MVAPTARPKNRVAMFVRAVPAVSLSLSVTPHSLRRFPLISIPIMGTDEGRTRPTKIVDITGNRIFSLGETGRSCFIRISLSAWLVRSRMMGGWMIGTRAI